MGIIRQVPARERRVAPAGDWKVSMEQTRQQVAVLMLREVEGGLRLLVVPVVKQLAEKLLQEKMVLLLPVGKVVNLRAPMLLPVEQVDSMVAATADRE